MIATKVDVRKLAEEALDVISLTQKGAVYAAIKGICAGTNMRGKAESIVFRRENGKIVLEHWTYEAKYRGQTAARITEYALPIDLRVRASVMLNNL